ncbi:MAG TPA: DUF1295 domain-containing protein [Caulobacteraceae bacterium]|nr:DUF1295 domain-containing protein [Caulobacteraceae bacterium]
MVLWLFVGALVMMSAVMAAGWLVQKRAEDSGWIDVFWTLGTGAAGVLSAFLFGEMPARAAVVGILVAVWSLRLGTHITLRVAKGPEDSRYGRLREEWRARYQANIFWFMQAQAPASAVLCLSIGLAAADPSPGPRLRDVAAVVIAAAAIIGEGLADAQLERFRRDPGNRRRINDRGLWAWSRHPNYFFEWLGWTAYPLIALDPRRPTTWLSLAAPVLMFLVLTRLTGVPYMEEHMAKSRGQAWAAYARRTSAFFPLPPRRS